MATASCQSAATHWPKKRCFSELKCAIVNHPGDMREDQMPRSIVDFSAISPIIKDEPFFLHFWESTPSEALEFMKNPRAELAKMGIELPPDCRVETTIENHDWLAARTNNFTRADDGPIIICGTGGGNVAKAYYKVSFYAHEKFRGRKIQKTTSAQRKRTREEIIRMPG